MYVVERNPLELKRRDQKNEGYIWFATYDKYFIDEDELRKVLSNFEIFQNKQGGMFPKVSLVHQ